MKHKQANSFNKSSIVIGCIAIAAVAIAGYSYYGGNTTTNTAAGSCGMMGGKRTQNNQTPSPTTTTVDANAQTITMNYNEVGALSPATIKLQSGKTYKIVININVDVQGCMSSMAIPGLTNDIQDIYKGTPVVFTITPTTPGTYEFTCAMGVPQGAKIIVQ